MNHMVRTTTAGNQLMLDGSGRTLSGSVGVVVVDCHGSRQNILKLKAKHKGKGEGATREYIRCYDCNYHRLTIDVTEQMRKVQNAKHE